MMAAGRFLREPEYFDGQRASFRVNSYLRVGFQVVLGRFPTRSTYGGAGMTTMTELANGLGLLAMTLGFGAGFGATMRASRRKVRDMQQLKARGIHMQASVTAIKNLASAYDNIDLSRYALQRWVEYSFRTSDGERFTSRFWAFRWSLPQVGDAVPVVYQPSAPENHLRLSGKESMSWLVIDTWIQMGIWVAFFLLVPAMLAYGALCVPDGELAVSKSGMWLLVVSFFAAALPGYRRGRRVEV